MEEKVREYNNLSKIHFIKRAKLRKEIYNEVLKECSSYQEFSEKCPIPFDKFEMIGRCMSEGKTVSPEQQNWYMAENQRRTQLEIQRRNEAAMREYQQRESRQSTSVGSDSSIKHIVGPSGLTTIMQTGNMTTVMKNGKTDIYTVL